MESPKVILELKDGELELTYNNTRLRTFADSSLDHIERRDDDGTLTGLRVGRAVLDLLFEKSFPMSYDPIPDSGTENWFVEVETRNLDDELDELFEA